MMTFIVLASITLLALLALFGLLYAVVSWLAPRGASHHERVSDLKHT